MKPSPCLVSGVLVSLAALVAAPGCSGGSRTTEPTTLPSASRPARPPTRVRTEQSREDPLEVDGRTERLGTLGGPLERRRLPSDEEPLDLPETDVTPKDDAAPAGARAPKAREATGDEDVPEDLQRGGPDPDAESEAETPPRGADRGTTTGSDSTGGATTTGGLIPIDVPPGAGATKAGKGSGSSKTKGTTSGSPGTGAQAGPREKAASETDTRQKGTGSSRPTGGDDDTGAGSAGEAEGGSGANPDGGSTTGSEGGASGSGAGGSGVAPAAR
jgi:hypothetical protein